MHSICFHTRRRIDTAKVIVAGMLLVAAGACRKAPAPGSEQPGSAPSSAVSAAAPPQVGPAPQPPPNTAAPRAQPMSPSSPSPAPSPATAAAPSAPVVVTPIVIPAGTHLSVRLERALGSAISAVGENFTATLVNGVRIQGAEVMHRRTPVVGKVVDAKPAGKFAGEASLGLQLESVDNHAVVTNTYSRRVEGKGKRTAVVIGGTAVAGALLGALAGHGRGAAIGAVAGGGIGTLGAAETGNSRNIVLPEGTVLSFKLRRAISVNPRSAD